MVHEWIKETSVLSARYNRERGTVTEQSPFHGISGDSDSELAKTEKLRAEKRQAT